MSCSASASASEPCLACVAPHEVSSTAVGAASSTHDMYGRHAEEAGASVLVCLTLETLEILALHPVEQAFSEHCSRLSSAPRAHPAPARTPAGQAPLRLCGTPRYEVHAGSSVLCALLRGAPAVNRRSGHVCCVQCANGCCTYLRTPDSAGVESAARAKAYRQPARCVWRPSQGAHSWPCASRHQLQASLLLVQGSHNWIYAAAQVRLEKQLVHKLQWLV